MLKRGFDDDIREVRDALRWLSDQTGEFIDEVVVNYPQKCIAAGIRAVNAYYRQRKEKESLHYVEAMKKDSRVGIISSDFSVYVGPLLNPILQRVQELNRQVASLPISDFSKQWIRKSIMKDIRREMCE